MSGLPENVRILFDAPNYAHVATVLPDGAPHTVPVWIALEGDQIAFLTSPNSRNASNLAREPRVAISITDRQNPHKMAQVRGRVTKRVEEDAAWTIIDRISNK